MIGGFSGLEVAVAAKIIFSLAKMRYSIVESSFALEEQN
jgi:hypothetical protein